MCFLQVISISAETCNNMSKVKLQMTNLMTFIKESKKKKFATILWSFWCQRNEKFWDNKEASSSQVTQ